MKVSKKNLNVETIRQIEALKNKIQKKVSNNPKTVAEQIVEMNKIGIKNILAYFGDI